MDRAEVRTDRNITLTRKVLMDEIVQQIVQRTGIPEDKARMAVQVVLDQLEKRLPGPIASQLREHLTGGASGASGLGDVARGLGGLFGQAGPG
jgi:hypothetical protein